MISDLTQLMCHECFKLLQKLWQEAYIFILVFVYPSHNLASHDVICLGVYSNDSSDYMVC